MASAIIHICIAHEANKILKINEKEFLLGSISPDIAKQVGLNKKKSHFIEGNRYYNSNPSLDLFLAKYENTLNNPFNLGYYCHLFVDYLWYGSYYLRYAIEQKLYYLDGHSKCLSSEELQNEIYKEYERLNLKIINQYDLDLSLFYEEPPIIESNIEEIPIDKLNVIIEKMGIIIENSKIDTNTIFDEESIYEFIDLASKLFIKHLKEIRII